eukprot:356475-Chlamydomonas_euryale.AAC.3
MSQVRSICTSAQPRRAFFTCTRCPMRCSTPPLTRGRCSTPPHTRRRAAPYVCAASASTRAHACQPDLHADQPDFHAGQLGLNAGQPDLHAGQPDLYAGVSLPLHAEPASAPSNRSSLSLLHASTSHPRAMPALSGCLLHIPTTSQACVPLSACRSLHAAVCVPLSACRSLCAAVCVPSASAILQCH